MVMKLPFRQRLVVLSTAVVLNVLILFTTCKLLSLRAWTSIRTTSAETCHVAPPIHDFEVRFTSVEKAFEAAQMTVSEEVVLEEPRIGKCSMTDDPFNPVYRHTLKLHERHNTIHDYPFHILQRPIIDYAWSKPAHVLSVLLSELSKPRSQRLDWLFWADADTVVMNPNIPLSAFLPPDDVVDDYEPTLLITKDFQGLNAGAFFLRVHPWSVELFSSIIASRKDDLDLPISSSPAAQDKLISTAISLQLQRDQFRDQTVFVPQHWFNAYPPNTPGNHQNQGVIQAGDLLVHVPSISDDDEYHDADMDATYLQDTKDDILQDWLDFSETRHRSWTLTLHDTNLPEETESFWSAYAAARRASWEREMEVQVQMGPSGRRREQRRQELERGRGRNEEEVEESEEDSSEV